MEKNYVLVYNKIQNRKEMSDRYHILSNKWTSQYLHYIMKIDLTTIYVQVWGNKYLKIWIKDNIPPSF